MQLKLSTSKNIKIGTIISLIGVIVSLLAHFLFTPFLLESVGKANYGIYSFVSNIVIWFTIAINSLSSSYIKFYSKYTKGENKISSSRLNGVFSTILGFYSLIVVVIGGLLTIFCFTGIIPLDGYSESEKQLIGIMLAISTISNALNIGLKVFYSNITYNSKFVFLRTLDIVTTILNSTLPIPFLLAGYGILTMSIVTSSTSILILLIDIIYAVFLLKFRLDFKGVFKERLLFKEIFIFTFILLINEISTKLNSSIDTTILGFKAYDEDVATYQLALQIVTQALSPVVLLSQNYSPTISDNITHGKYEENNKIFLKISLIQTILWLTIMGGFASCGQTFIKLWLGEGYEDVYIIACVLLIIETTIATTTAANSIEILSNKHLYRALIILGTTILNLIITVILVNVFSQEYAIYGCLIGTIVSYIIGYWIILSIYHKKSVNLQIGKYFLNLVKLFLLCCVAFGVSALASYLLHMYFNMHNIIYFLIEGSIFTILYAGLVLAFYHKQIIEYIKNLKNRYKNKNMQEKQ